MGKEATVTTDEIVARIKQLDQDIDALDGASKQGAKRTDLLSDMLDRIDELKHERDELRVQLRRLSN